MNHVEAFFTGLLAICGAVTVIYGAANAVTKIFSPYKELEKKVKNYSLLFENDNNRLDELEKTNKLLLKCMFTLIDHEITGNGVENLKELRSEVRDFLVEK